MDILRCLIHHWTKITCGHEVLTMGIGGTTAHAHYASLSFFLLPQRWKRAACHRFLIICPHSKARKASFILQVVFMLLSFNCSVMSNSVTPMDCSMPGSPVLHYIPKSAQTHVYWVGDAIQTSHFLLSPSPPAFNLSQHQGLYQWVGSSQKVAEVLGVSTSVSVLPNKGWFPLWLTDLISLQSKGFSRVFSSTAVQNHHFFGIQSSLWSLTSVHDYWKNHSFDYMDLCQKRDVSAF